MTTVYLKELVKRKIGYGIVQPGDSRALSIPVIKVNNIISGLNNIDALDKTTHAISQKFSRTVLRGGELLVSVVGTIGKTAIVPLSFSGCNIARAVAMIDIQDPILALWVKYYIDSPQGQAYIIENLNTTVQATLNIKDLENMPVPLFDRSQLEQRVAVLRSLDDKITLNNRINHNLEQQAHALYKSWFVDFEPFKDGKFADSEFGPIPDGWRVGSIYEICDVYYGAPFNSTLFNSEKKGLPLIRIRDLVKQVPGVFTEETHPKGQLTNRGDILVGMDGEFSIHVWGGVPSWINQRISRFIPKRGVGHFFLSETLRPQLKAVESSEVATTVIHIGKNDYDKFLSIIPTQNVLESFYYLSEPLFLQYVENLLGNQVLSESRDALLPRLMSGIVHFDC